MAIYNSLSAWVTDVNKVHTLATYRAMNKAASKTRTQFQRAVAKETGLKSKQLSKRFLTKKASKKSLNAYVSLGVKFGVSLAEFSPKLKVVKKNKRKYNGVTVKIPQEGGRFLVPKGFIMRVKSGKSLVVARTTEARTPTSTLRYRIENAGLAHQASMRTLFSNEFKAQFRSQLNYEMSKK